MKSALNRLMGGPATAADLAQQINAARQRHADLESRLVAAEAEHADAIATRREALLADEVGPAIKKHEGRVLATQTSRDGFADAIEHLGRQISDLERLHEEAVDRETRDATATTIETATNEIEQARRDLKSAIAAVSPIIHRLLAVDIGQAVPALDTRRVAAMVLAEVLDRVAPEVFRPVALSGHSQSRAVVRERFDPVRKELSPISAMAGPFADEALMNRLQESDGLLAELRTRAAGIRAGTAEGNRP